MGFSRTLAAALVLCSMAQTGFAQCRICDEVIELNAEYAQCFAQKYDAMLSTLATSGTGRIKVDLADCAGGAVDQERSGLLVMPSLTGQPRPPKSVYILDAAYLTCLNDLLVKYDGAFDPQAQFDLFEQCQ